MSEEPEFSCTERYSFGWTRVTVGFFRGDPPGPPESEVSKAIRRKDGRSGPSEPPKP